jgi:DNA polymerase III sliding clamp (beta) subunit (PCNA family)
MKIKREDLLGDLEQVKAGLSPREFIEQSSCFVFQDGQVMTFNDEVACRKEIGINVTGAVQATSLLDILTRLDDTFLAVRETDSQLQFRGERKEFGVVKDAEIFLPIDRVETPEKWHKLSPKFIEAISAVERCVSTDESRFTLTCVHIHPEWIEACDNHQLMRVYAQIGIKKPMLVRGSSISHVRSLSMNQIATTPGWVHFRNETGLILSCRRYEDSYPDLTPILEMEEASKITLPKSAAATSERAGVFAMDKSGDALLAIKLSPNRMLIKGTGLTGYYQEYKDLDYDGPTIEFGINPELFKWLCENYNNAEISEDRFKAKGDDEGHSWEYVSRLVPTTEEPEEAPLEEQNENAAEAE